MAGTTSGSAIPYLEASDAASLIAQGSEDQANRVDDLITPYRGYAKHDDASGTTIGATTGAWVTVGLDTFTSTSSDLTQSADLQGVVCAVPGLYLAWHRIAWDAPGSGTRGARLVVGATAATATAVAEANLTAHTNAHRLGGGACWVVEVGTAGHGIWAQAITSAVPTNTTGPSPQLIVRRLA